MAGPPPGPSSAGCSWTAPPAPAGSSTGGFAAGAWRVNNANAEQLSASAPVFVSYRWGRSGELPVVGDWDGDGTQTVGVVRPNPALHSNHLLLRNGDGSVLDFWYGRHGDRILVGDWNGDGTFTPAAVRNGVWWLRNTNSTGGADATVGFGRAGDRYLAGDWDGDGDFTPGCIARAPSGSATAPAAAAPRSGSASAAPTTSAWSATGTTTAPGPRACSAPAPAGT